MARKTAETEPGKFDEARDRDFHVRLAQHCRDASEPLWNWEEIYHLARASKHDQVLERATPEFFREQVLQFRPIASVQSDIRLAMASLRSRNDFVALARLCLAGSEVGQRGFYLDDASGGHLLLSLGLRDAAVEHFRDGNRLRLSAASALEVVGHLLDAGLGSEAKRIFELAEPLGLLAGEQGEGRDPQDKEGELLDLWAHTSPNFYSLEEIRDSIVELGKRLAMAKGESPRDAVETKVRMYYHVAEGLLDASRVADLKKFLRMVSEADPDSMGWLPWFQVKAWEDLCAAGDRANAAEFLDDFLKTRSPSEMKPATRIRVAEGLFRIAGKKEEVEKWLDGVEQPPLQTKPGGGGRGFDRFWSRLRLNRLLGMLGVRKSASEIVPKWEKSSDEGLVYFERAVCILAQIWGRAWAGEVLGVEAVREAHGLLRVFYQDWTNTQDWYSWHDALGARGEFYELLVEAIAEHGKDAVILLSEELEKEWTSEGTKNYWSVDVRRRITLALSSKGVDGGWVANQLEACAAELDSEATVDQRVDECREQAFAWIQFGDLDKASGAARKMLDLSFGIGYRKDYQLDEHLEWLQLASQEKPEHMAEWLATLAAYTVSAESMTEGRAARFAVNKLLEVSWGWSPSGALTLFDFFCKQGIPLYSEAMEEVVRSAISENRECLPILNGIVGEMLIPAVSRVVWKFSPRRLWVDS